MAATALFTLCEAGQLEAALRIVLATMTRFRGSGRALVPNEFYARHFRQRATPDRLLTTEAAHIPAETASTWTIYRAPRKSTNSPADVPGCLRRTLS